MRRTLAILFALQMLGGTVSSAVAGDIAEVASATQTRQLQHLLPQIATAARGIEEGGQRISLLTVIAKAASRIKETATSQALLAEAAEQARQSTDLVGQAFDLMTVASAYADIGEAEAARKLFAEAAVANPDDSALLELAATQANEGQIADALAVARNIGRAYYRAPALSAVARAQAESGGINSSNALFNEAFATANEIPVSGGLRATMYAEVLSDLAVARAQAGDIKGVKDTMPYMKGDRPLGRVVKALARRGDFDNALLIAEDMGSAQRGYAQIDILAELAAAGDFAKVIALTDTLFATGTVDHNEAAVAVATAQAKAGDPDGARATAAGVLLRQPEPDRTPDANDPASLWTNKGSTPQPAPSDGIAQYLGKTIWNSAADDPASRRKDTVLAAIAAAEAKVGNQDKALEAMQGISSPMWRVIAFIDVKIAADRTDDALAAALSSDALADRAILLSHLVEMLSIP